MLKLLTFLWGNLIYFISYLVPKNKNIWVFGAWGGNAFSDNSKYLFKFVTHNHPEITAIWLTRKKSIIKKLRAERYQSYSINSFMGILTQIRASVGITSNGMVDLNRFACAKMKIVETWHGIPMKPVLLSDTKKATISHRKKLLKLSVVFPFLRKALAYDDFLAICGSSEQTNTILKKVFGNGAPIIKSGFPRLDGLLNPSKGHHISSQILVEKNNGREIGIYMPTYRQIGEFDVINYFLSNLDKIENVLKKSDKSLYLKIHPFDAYKIPKAFHSDYLYFMTNDDIEDIYEVLGLFDFLISDYSSVIFDFTILSKPIFILAPDRFSYMESNGEFVFDYLDLELPTFDNWKDLLNILDVKYWHLRKSPKNESLKNRFHAFNDMNNSHRLFNYIANS